MSSSSAEIIQSFAASEISSGSGWKQLRAMLAELEAINRIRDTVTNLELSLCTSLSQSHQPDFTDIEKLLAWFPNLKTLKLNLFRHQPGDAVMSLSPYLLSRALLHLAISLEHLSITTNHCPWEIDTSAIQSLQAFENLVDIIIPTDILFEEGKGYEPEELCKILPESLEHLTLVAHLSRSRTSSVSDPGDAIADELTQRWREAMPMLENMVTGTGNLRQVCPHLKSLTIGAEGIMHQAGAHRETQPRYGWEMASKLGTLRRAARELGFDLLHNIQPPANRPATDPLWIDL